MRHFPEKAAALFQKTAAAFPEKPCRFFPLPQGVYRLGSNQTWPAGEIVDQLLYNTKLGEVDGSIFFSYRSVFSPSNPTMREGVARVLRDCWRTPVPAPEYRNIR